MTSEGGVRLMLSSRLDAAGMLPPGRYAASLDELHAEFVAGTGSTVRQQLWEEWTQHRACVEATVQEIARAWIAGSFVSSKPDPGDIDVTYLVKARFYDQLTRDDLGFLWELTEHSWCVGQGMRVHAFVVRLPEPWAVPDSAPSLFQDKESASFRDIGFYDELWQRSRDSFGYGHDELRRGYVEVLL